MLASLLITLSIFFTSVVEDSVIYIKDGKTVYNALSDSTNIIKKTISELKKQKIYHESGLFFIKDATLNWKMFNAKGVKLNDSTFQHFLIINNNCFAIQNQGYYKLINAQGKYISNQLYSLIKKENNQWKLKPANKIEIRNYNAKIENVYAYDSIHFLNEHWFIFKVGNLFGLKNYVTDKVLFHPAYDKINLLNDTLFIVEKNNKKGLLDLKGNWIIPLEYDHISKDTLNYIRIAIKKKINQQVVTKFGICNYTGRVILPPQYDEIGFFANPYFGVRIDKNWGYVDTKGETAIPFLYAKIGQFNSKGFAPVSVGFMAGVIDLRGAWVVFRAFQSFQAANDSVWLWKKGNEMGFFNAHTGLIETKSYQSISVEPLGFFRVEQNGQYGLLNPQKASVINVMYESVQVYDKEQVIITSNKKYYSIYYLNGNLKVFMNYPFSTFLPYTEGMAMVVQKEKYGFIDKDGLLLVSTQYDEAKPFCNDMAAIRIGKKWGFINSHEKIIVPPHYDEVKNYFNNVAIIKLSGKYGFVNKSGDEIIKPIFDYIHQTPNNQYIIGINNRYGLVNINGIETVNPVYKFCEELSADALKVKLYDKYNFVSSSNNQMLSNQQYDNIQYSSLSQKYILTVKSDWEIFKTVE